MNRLQSMVEAWDPAGTEDLPDEVAMALDADPAFRAWFDERFARWVPPAETEVPPGLLERVLPGDEPTLAIPKRAAEGPPARPIRPANRWIWAVAGTGALAAAALAIVVTAGVGGGVAWVSRDVASEEMQAPLSPSNEPAAVLDGPAAREALGRRDQPADAQRQAHAASARSPVQPRRPAVGTAVPNPAPVLDPARWSAGDEAQVTGDAAPDAPRGLAKDLLEDVPTGRSYQESVSTVAGISSGEGRESRVTVGGALGVAQNDSDGRFELDGVEQAPRRGDAGGKGKRRDRLHEAPVGGDGDVASLDDDDEDLSEVTAARTAPGHREKDLEKLAWKDGKKKPDPNAVAVPQAIHPVPAVSGVHPQITESLSVTRADYPGFVRTAQDPLSTFSIDVDTASYTQIRRTLGEGYLPPTDAVRLEEMINYFPYDYAPPAAGEPFSVAVEGAPSPWGGTDLVRIGVQGKKVTGRAASHLTFLVDVSGSMSGPDRLGLVQESLKMLVSGLGDGDTVALVVYAGSSGVVLEPTAIRNKAEIVAAIDRLQAGGSTAMGQGIEMAYKLADQTYAKGAVNRVIIASDGDANVGVTDTAALSELISRYAKKGITLTTLGFGSGNYRDTRMEQLANDGDGNYFYIDSQKEARRVLVDKLTSTLEVIAKDVKLQVDWNPKVVRKYRLLGYENRNIADRDFRVDAVDAGEIGAGHQVTAIYEVERLPDARGDLFTLRVRSKAPGPDSPAVERRFSGSSEAMRASLAETSRDFRIAVGAAMFGERLRGSPFAPGFSYDEIGKLVRGAHKGPEDAELAGLVERARRLTSEGGPGCRDIAYEDDDGQLVRRRIDRDGNRCE